LVCEVPAPRPAAAERTCSTSREVERRQGAAPLLHDERYGFSQSQPTGRFGRNQPRLPGHPIRTFGEWLDVCLRARVSYVELRPTGAERSSALQHRLALLVLERQKLREREASRFVLEQNRLDIVQAQQELAQALVSEHTAPSAA
jgi:hypothetical protein